MLLQFNFKNCLSFKNSATLDLTATKISEYADHIIEFGEEKILPAVGIFGANASGKSNVYYAFEYMRYYVMKSIRFANRSDWDDDDAFSPPTPFLFDKDSRNDGSEFEVYFTACSKDGQERFYNYGFVIDRDGVKEEWLNSKAKTSRGEYKTVFYRNGDELDLSGLPSSSHSNIKNGLGTFTLVVSLGAQIQVGKLKLISDWFAKSKVVNFGDAYENAWLSRRTPRGFSTDTEVRKKVVEYLSSFDPAILDFIVEQSIDKDNPTKKKLTIDAVHRMTDGKSMCTIPLETESSGTLKMFALYQYLMDVMDNGGVLFVDELNSKLHPLLVRMIVTLFFNKKINTKNAQLIFTSHDSWQLNNHSLRRDEIWFAEKDDKGISTLYSLVDFVDENGDKIRKDENVQKNYLLGKYGAIPRLTFFDISNDITGDRSKE